MRSIINQYYAEEVESDFSPEEYWMLVQTLLVGKSAQHFDLLGLYNSYLLTRGK